jgi:hypothetical protein
MENIYTVRTERKFVALKTAGSTYAYVLNDCKATNLTTHLRQTENSLFLWNLVIVMLLNLSENAARLVTCESIWIMT